MRPVSIINFERFYLASIAFSVLGLILSWDRMIGEVRGQPNMPFGESTVSSILIVSFGLGILIPLLLWFFAARRASAVAKWIITIFFAITLLQLLVTSGTIIEAVRTGTTPVLSFGLSLLTILLNALAVWMLFRPDANAWFANRGAGPDADVFR